ncbi:MAG: hypothetical protein AB7O26_10630, partial [Planctomycetaceae bacterium]
MALLRKHGLLHKFTCGCSIVATLLLVPQPSAQAAPRKRPARIQKAQPESAVAKETDPADSQETAVRLNFMSATWPDVLQKLAKDTGSTLVMQETPPGRFSRTDMQKYSRGEAIRILNRALEPKGFRIVEKNQFLIVLHLNDVRSQYRRPVVRDGNETEIQSLTPIVDVRPRSVQEAMPVQDTVVTDVTPRRTVRQVSHEDEIKPATDRSGSRTAAAVADSGATSVVAVNHADAAYVAKVLYNALKERSELIDDGPNGLPGFRTRAKKKPEGADNSSTARRSSPAGATPAEFSVG